MQLGHQAHDDEHRLRLNDRPQRGSYAGHGVRHAAKRRAASALARLVQCLFPLAHSNVVTAFQVRGTLVVWPLPRAHHRTANVLRRRAQPRHRVACDVD